ncbi:MAG: hypothetical protein C3F19_16000 [Rhodocyclales bacterium]|nr:MAG: hypothetical protein C3F19_16000 [Rhodocyclales bacterium]
MKCQACSADNRENAKFCFKCGTRLSIEEPPQANAEPANKNNVCPSCSSPYKPEAKFCPRCGLRLIPESSDHQSSARHPGETTPPVSDTSLSVNKPVHSPVQVAPDIPAVRTQIDQPTHDEVILSGLSSSTADTGISPPTIAPALESAEKAIAPAPTAPIEKKNGHPEESSHSTNGRKGIFIGAMIVVALAVAGGGYWYFLNGSTSQDDKEIDLRTGNVRTAPQGTTNPSESPPPAAPVENAKSAQEAPNNKKGKRASNPSNQPSTVNSRKVPSAEATPANDAVGLPNPAGAKRSCSETSGIYKVTCMIEGADRYFRCAPDGKTWRHDTPECYRR